MKEKLFYTVMPLFVLACTSGSEKNETSGEAEASEANVVVLTKEQLANAAIQVGKLEDKSILMRLQVNGLVDVPPQSMVSISFPLGGYLKSTQLLPGMRIRKGQVLAVLEDPQFIQLQQDYLIAAAKLRYAEADYQRQQSLSATQATSEKTLQLAKSDYENQLITVKALSAKLELIHINPKQLSVENISRTVQIYSPINGFVSKVNVNIGKYVSPTEVLFELVDPSDIHLNLTVFEKDAAYLQIGQKVVAYTNNKPDEKHEADIFLISHNINEDRAVQVHCHFDDYDPLLLPGMYMNALVEVKQQKAPSLPDAAVVRWQNKYYVFLATANNKFIMTEVHHRGSSDGFTAVEPVGTAWKDDAQFVTANAYTLLMKLKNSAEEE